MHPETVSHSSKHGYFAPVEWVVRLAVALTISESQSQPRFFSEEQQVLVGF